MQNVDQVPKAIELDEVEWLGHQVFSEEKIFTVDAAFNKWNDCWITSSTSKVQHKMMIKNHTSVMVFFVVSPERDVFTHFFNKEEKVNTKS